MTDIIGSTKQMFPLNQKVIAFKDEAGFKHRETGRLKGPSDWGQIKVFSDFVHKRWMKIQYIGGEG